MDRETEALVILSSLPQIGSIKGRLALHHFGSAQAALDASPAELSALPGFGPKIVDGWTKWKVDSGWKRNLELVERYGAQLIPFTHPAYPKRLLEIADFPIIIYALGTLLPQDQQSLAVVGTRFSSPYGNAMAQTLSKELANSGITIVSGLARGIDTLAHIGALQGGRTLAVIGSGLANIYPQENKELAQAISQKGALISEFPMLTAPDRQNFPQRNRIVAGMTRGTLLIEAPLKSGAMITMEKAQAYKRKLYALPGRADGDHFRGNHFLIKQGMASLVEEAADILRDFGDFFGNTPGTKSTPPLPKLEPEEQALYAMLSSQEKSFEELLAKTQIPVQKLSILLMSLQLKRLVKELPGKWYRVSL